MIELKEAVSRSLDALKNMALIPEATPVELEEAELENDGSIWTVTFSYPDPQLDSDSGYHGTNLRALMGKRRAYKAVRVFAADGSIRGIKSVHV
jgi:hypothetical protein